LTTQHITQRNRALVTSKSLFRIVSATVLYQCFTFHVLHSGIL